MAMGQVDQPLHAIVETTMAFDGQAQTMVMEQWTDGPERMRIEYLESDGLMMGMAGFTTVSDGETMWTYDPLANSYTEMAMPDYDAFSPDSAQMTAQRRRSVEQMLETMDFSFEGVEEVAERRTYKLRATPKEGEEDTFFLSGLGEATLWVDAETWHVLRQEMAMGEMGTMTMLYREVDFNPDFPADTFTFVPPEDATQQVSTVPQVEQMTLEEARATVDFQLLAPTELPAGWEFESAQVVGTSGVHDEGTSETSVMLTYSSEDGMLMINQAPHTEGMRQLQETEGIEATTLDVRGQEATLLDFGGGQRMLMWQEDDLNLMMTGSLSEEALLRVAESLQ